MKDAREPSADVQNLLAAGRKIDAIKLVRAEQNLGLKEAKELVEDYLAQHPERFPEVQRDASSGTRFVLYATILIAIVLTYRYFFAE